MLFLLMSDLYYLLLCCYFDEVVIGFILSYICLRAILIFWFVGYLLFFYLSILIIILFRSLNLFLTSYSRLRPTTDLISVLKKFSFYFIYYISSSFISSLLISTCLFSLSSTSYAVFSSFLLPLFIFSSYCANS